MRSRLVGICVVALAGCGGGRSSGPVSNQAPRAQRVISADPLALIPIDSEVVGYLDVQKLRASPTWQRFEPMMLEKMGAVVGQVKTECGYDPLTTLRSVTLGAKNLDAPDTTGVMVLRGLDRAKTMACWDRYRSKSQDNIVIDHDVITATTSNGERASFTFADDTTLVAMVGKSTTAASVGAVLDSGVPLKQSTAFTDLLATVRVADPLWLLVNGNSRLFDKAAGLGVKPKALSGSVDLATGLAATVRVRLGSPDEAQQLAGMAGSQLGMAKAMFDRLDATADKSDFVLEVRMTQTQLDNVVQMAGGMLGSNGP